jgi:hypothetical protein
VPPDNTGAEGASQEFSHVIKAYDCQNSLPLKPYRLKRPAIFIAAIGDQKTTLRITLTPPLIKYQWPQTGQKIILQLLSIKIFNVA